MSYGRFFAMIATSTVVMFGLMYFNTYLLSHVFWSETRAYMALVMGATMAIIMLSFMLANYSSKRVNVAIYVGAILVFALSLWLVRSQATVDDRSFMRAMIPHHSIAIMTSSRANITDPHVRKLADEIIYAQDKEIAEMRFMIDHPGVLGDVQEAAPASIVTLGEALSTAHVATVDPQFLREEDLAQLFPSEPSCVFRYTEDSPPVLAMGDVDGQSAALVRISNDLVRLSGEDASDAARAFSSDGLTIQLDAAEDAEALTGTGTSLADMRLTIDDVLSAGYRGHFECSG